MNPKQPQRVEERLVETKQIAVDAKADVVKLEREQGMMEVRVTSLEKFMDALIDPEKGVIPKLAVLEGKIGSMKWMFGSVIALMSLILVVTGWLLVIHLHP
jgi:hypothetical protein